LDGDRVALEGLARGAAELALVVSPPAPEVSIHVQPTGEGFAGREGDQGRRMRLDRERAGRGRAVAELAVVVGAQAVRVSFLGEKAEVVRPRRDGDRRRGEGDGLRFGRRLPPGDIAPAV